MIAVWMLLVVLSDPAVVAALSTPPPAPTTRDLIVKAQDVLRRLQGIPTDSRLQAVRESEKVTNANTTP